MSAPHQDRFDDLNELSDSFNELRRSLIEVEPPPFQPRRPVGPVLAAVALVAAAGAWMFYDANNRPIAVQTEPAAEVGPIESEPAATENAEYTPSLVKVITALDGGDGFDVVPVTDSETETAAVVAINNAVSSWNVDGSALVLYRTGGTYVVIRPDEPTVVNEFPLGAIDIEHVFWDSSDPNLLHALTTEGIKTVDPFTGEILNQLEIPDCQVAPPRALGPYVGPTNQVGLRCQGAEGDRWLVVDLDGQVMAESPALSDGFPTPSPSGEYVLVAKGQNQVTVYDKSLDSQVAEFNWNSKLVVGFDADGREAVFGPEYDDSDAIGSLVAADIATGAKRVILGPEVGEPYPMAGIDIAASANGQLVIGAGFADTSSPDSSEGTLQAGSLHRIDLGTGEVTEIEQSTNRVSGDGPWHRWFPDLSPDGRQVAFTAVGDDGQVITRVLR